MVVAQYSAVPHPFDLQNVLCPKESEQSPQPLWIQLRNRKARIFAATRRLMAECEPHKLSMRKIAEAAEVSVPTIYNLVGDREAVITGAINDHTMALCQYAKSAHEHWHFVSALAFAYWRSVAIAPGFMRNISIHYNCTSAAHREELRLVGVRSIAASLAAAQARGLMRDDINLKSTSARASALISATIHEWALDTYDHEELGRELAAASNIVLKSALKAGPQAANAEMDSFIACDARQRRRMYS
jgi:AcrR family transcriptional regulator